jgi:hypothetical protein
MTMEVRDVNGYLGEFSHGGDFSGSFAFLQVGHLRMCFI